MDAAVRIGPPTRPWPRARLEALRRALEGCRGVAFAHLPEVLVPGRQERPHPVLFVWLDASALATVRRSLDRVCRAVARVVPHGEFVDVVILNSAPELLEAVEAAGCLVAEADPDERRAALAAAAAGPGEPVPADPRPTRRRWRPPWRR